MEKKRIKIERDPTRSVVSMKKTGSQTFPIHAAKNPTPTGAAIAPIKTNPVTMPHPAIETPPAVNASAAPRLSVLRSALIGIGLGAAGFGGFLYFADPHGERSKKGAIVQPAPPAQNGAPVMDRDRSPRDPESLVPVKSAQVSVMAERDAGAAILPLESLITRGAHSLTVEPAIVVSVADYMLSKNLTVAGKIIGEGTFSFLGSSKGDPTEVIVTPGGEISILKSPETRSFRIAESGEVLLRNGGHIETNKVFMMTSRKSAKSTVINHGTMHIGALWMGQGKARLEVRGGHVLVHKLSGIIGEGKKIDVRKPGALFLRKIGGGKAISRPTKENIATWIEKGHLVGDVDYKIVEIGREYYFQLGNLETPAPENLPAFPVLPVNNRKMGSR